MKVRVRFNHVFEESPHVIFHDVAIAIRDKLRCIFAIGWARKKGDWWYSKDRPDTPKFFWTSKDDNDTLTRWSVYIGRLAFTFMKGK